MNNIYLVAYKCYQDIGWGEKSGLKVDTKEYSFPDDHELTVKDLEELRKNIYDVEWNNNYKKYYKDGRLIIKILSVTKLKV